MDDTDSFETSLNPGDFMITSMQFSQSEYKNGWPFQFLCLDYSPGISWLFPSQVLIWTDSAQLFKISQNQLVTAIQLIYDSYSYSKGKSGKCIYNSIPLLWVEVQNFNNKRTMKNRGSIGCCFIARVIFIVALIL